MYGSYAFKFVSETGKNLPFKMPRNCFGFLCCVLLMSSFVCVLSSNLPDYIHICHRSDPKVSKCIKRAVEALRPKLIQGIPELGVPGIDPFHIDRIIIFDGAQNPNLKAHLENVEVMGVGNFEVTKLKLHVDTMTYRVGIKLPYLHLEGDFDVDVKILQAPIVGHGKFSANTTGLEGHVIIQGYIENKRLKFKSLDSKILVHDFNVKLDNLFGGSNEILSQATNELLNTNKEDLIRLTTPFIERKCSEIFLRLANQITTDLIYDEVFPL